MNRTKTRNKTRINELKKYRDKIRNNRKNLKTVVKKVDKITRDKELNEIDNRNKEREYINKVSELEKQRIVVLDLKSKIEKSKEKFKDLVKKGDIAELDRLVDSFDFSYKRFWGFRYAVEATSNIELIKYFLKTLVIPRKIVAESIGKCIQNSKYDTVRYVIDYLEYLDKLGLVMTSDYQDLPKGFTYNEGTRCPISLELFKEPDVTLICSSCKNQFSLGYIDEWLDKPNNLCPMCRQTRKFYVVRIH